MSNLVPFASSGDLAPRDNRRLARGRSTQQVSRRLRGGQVELETDLAIDKIQNATIATGSGMRAVVGLSKLQRDLELLAPDAAARLALIADAHALDVADTLADLRLRLRGI